LAYGWLPPRAGRRKPLAVEIGASIWMPYPPAPSFC